MIYQVGGIYFETLKAARYYRNTRRTGMAIILVQP